MRTVSVYRPVRKKRTKAVFLIALLLAMSFLAGAVTEKTVHFLFKERFFFKINPAVDQIKWATVIIISILTDYRHHSIRGP